MVTLGLCLKQVKLLFAGERQLCDQVFECSQSLRDKCFAAITKNSLATLLSFGEAIAMSKRSPEKLFVLLDMYEIMCELQTEVIYSHHSCSDLFQQQTISFVCKMTSVQLTYMLTLQSASVCVRCNVEIFSAVSQLNISAVKIL
jgi:exocyst complex component 7